MKKMLVVDGNSIINRAFYGVKQLNTSEGFPTNALFGFVNMLEKQISEQNPDYCAIAFDVKHPTFRHEMYPEYKAGRRPMPEELVIQFPLAKELAAALGFTVIEKKGYEADDILGTLSRYASPELNVLLMTGDRDAFQLISDHTTVLYVTKHNVVDYTLEYFRERFEFETSQYLDAKALMGDSSDNIPGVKGIGEKTTKMLIKQFSSLDNLYASYATSDLTQSLRDKIEQGKESAYLSKELARICCDVPLDVTLEDIKYRGMDRVAARALFERFEFYTFMQRYGMEFDESVLEEPKQPSFEREQITNESLRVVRIGDKAAISVTEDGILELFNGNTLYVYDLNTLDNYAIATLLQKNASKLVCHDCKTIYKTLRSYGIVIDSCGFDVMLGAYVLDSGEAKYDLYSLATRFLKCARKDDEPIAVTAYALHSTIAEQLESEGGVNLMNDIEMPLASVLAEMELYGFKLDRKGIRDYGVMLDSIAAQNELAIYEYAGEPFNINSTKQLGVVLFEKLQLPHGKKTKTGYSTSADILEKLIPYHPIIPAILDYRKVTKLKSTYVDGLLRQADAMGRVHTTFKQTGTATGRLSSIEPNLQNIPIKTDLGRLMRKFFVAENEEYVLIDADYSQIELRLLAHISGDEDMRRAFLEGKDIHAATAARVFGVPLESVTYEMRKRAKAINFGILYGMGEFTLSNDLNISMKDAKAYIASYLAGYPAVDAYLKSIKEVARENGYVTTMYGRRRYIPEIVGKNKMLRAFGERVAMNSPIQGSAADIIKIAMINVSRRLKEEGLDARLILQVHDELLIEASVECADAAKQILSEEMQNAARLTVPLTVDCKMGKTWLDA